MCDLRANGLKLIFGLLCLLLASGQVKTQTVTGTISGTVVDASGSVIVGATLTLVNERTGDIRTLLSNDEGAFSFAAVQPGVYTVKVELPGFRTFTRAGTVLSAN